MKYIEQAEAECYPTVVAMLSDKPVQQVIPELLRGTSCKTWMELMAMFDLTQSERLIQTVNGNAKKILPWITDRSLRAFSNEYPANLNSSVLNGRGTMSIQRGRLGHVVAFENGLVYDPGLHQPAEWRIWKAMYDAVGARIVNLTVDPQSTGGDNEEAEETESEIRRYLNSEREAQ